MSQKLTTSNNSHNIVFLSAAFYGLLCLSFPISSFAKPSADSAMVKVSESGKASKNEPAAQYVKQFALMALFAKASYRKDIENIKVRPKNPCDYITHPPTDVLPKNWMRSNQAGACYSSNNDTDKGLYFETYVHPKNSESKDKAVISIRGTESKDIEDIKANASGIFPFKKTEYTEAKENIIALIDALKAQGVKEIYLTGHSLGGGIAQEIAQLSGDEITRTYTFNSSPVTNWLKNIFKGEVKNNSPIIDRVYLNNEILSYIRKITTQFNHPLPNRTDYQFNFPSKLNIIKAHGMSHLTCYLASQVTEEGADFDYQKEDAEAVLGNQYLCPEGSV